MVADCNCSRPQAGDTHENLVSINCNTLKIFFQGLSTVSVVQFLQKVQDIHATGKATEHSYRSALNFLFASVGDNTGALNEPKAVKVGRHL